MREAATVQELELLAARKPVTYVKVASRVVAIAVEVDVEDRQGWQVLNRPQQCRTPILEEHDGHGHLWMHTNRNLMEQHP